MTNEIRPTVATIFGILNVVFGGFAILLGFMSVGLLVAKFADYPVTTVFGLFGIVVAALEIYTGILLVTNKKNAIFLLKSYLIVAFIALAGNIIAAIIQDGTAAIMASIFSVIFGLSYQALLFFLVLKSEPVKRYYASR